MIYSIVGILIVILDQLVKFWVEKTISLEKPIIELIPGVLSIVKVQNDGAAFSFLSGGGARIWFIILTVVFAVLVIIALATNFISGRFGRWCLVVVTAGGISNCLDRVLYGYVVDMFKVELFDFAVFNVADIFITVGCIAFIIYILFGGEKDREPDADEFDEIDEEPIEKVKLPKREKKQRVIIPDDDDEEDEDFAPARKPAKKTKAEKASEESERELRTTIQKSRAGHNTNPQAAGASDEFEAFFSRNTEKKTPVKAAPVRKQPIEVETENEGLYTGPETKAEEEYNPFAEWDRASGKTATKAESVKSEPVKSEPVKRETVKPQTSAPSVSSDDFDLDSILKEFK